MRNCIRGWQLPSAMGHGMLSTKQKLRSVPAFSPLPSSVSPNPGYSFLDDLLPLEASCTNLFYHFWNMTNLHSRCDLLNGLNNAYHLLSTYYWSRQLNEVGAIIYTCFTEEELGLRKGNDLPKVIARVQLENAEPDLKLRSVGWGVHLNVLLPTSLKAIRHFLGTY